MANSSRLTPLSCDDSCHQTPVLRWRPDFFRNSTNARRQPWLVTGDLAKIASRSALTSCSVVPSCVDFFVSRFPSLSRGVFRRRLNIKS